MGADGLDQPLAPRADDECTDTLNFSYLRRRPMHPDRFRDFVRCCFGPFDEEPEELCGAESGRNDSHHLSSLGSFCRRRNPERPSEPQRPSEPSGLTTFSNCKILCASGCVWLAGFDERQLEWLWNDASPSSRHDASPSSRHSLRVATPWDAGNTDECREAGERRVDLKFILQVCTEAVGEAMKDHGEVLKAGKAALRDRLQACLLTRSEAEALDRKEPLEEADSRAIRRMAGVLWVVAGIVSSLPGSQTLAAFGESTLRRITRLLGAPDGHGHVDDIADAPCKPCEPTDMQE